MPGYLALKSREDVPGKEITIRSSGPLSVATELDRFFGLAPGTARPYINPFGSVRRHVEWLRIGYERWGVYTHLLPGRTLSGFISAAQVREEDGQEVLQVSAPSSGSESLASQLPKKLPLEPTAAFLLRREDFRPDATRKSLIDRFQAVFHLSSTELAALFVEVPDFQIQFSTTKFEERIDSLPPDLHPIDESSGHAVAAVPLVGSILTAVEVGDLIFSDAVLRRGRRALAREKGIAFVGPPGTGKSRLVDLLVEDARNHPEQFDLSKAPEFDRHAAEVDWTARTLVGGYFPNSQGILVFQEGCLLQAIRHNHWLILDEMNRADLDRVLGPVFTFLAGEHVDVDRTELTEGGKPISLAWGTEPESRVWEDDYRRIYVAGTDWRIIGTYNNVDVGRVFTMGAALTRRWAMVPVPPLDPDQLPEVLQKVVGLPAGAIDVIKELYAVHQAFLPLGPAPFVDMARYVAGDEGDAGATPAQAAGALTPQADTLVSDAYILHVGRQLRRLALDRQEEFYTHLRTLLGSDVVNELRAF